MNEFIESYMVVAECIPGIEDAHRVKQNKREYSAQIQHCNGNQHNTNLRIFGLLFICFPFGLLKTLHEFSLSHQFANDNKTADKYDHTG